MGKQNWEGSVIFPVSDAIPQRDSDAAESIGEFAAARAAADGAEVAAAGHGSGESGRRHGGGVEEDLRKAASNKPSTITAAVRAGYRLLETDIELGYKIGEGNFGTVYEGMYLDTKVTEHLPCDLCFLHVASVRILSFLYAMYSFASAIRLAVLFLYDRWR